MVPEPVYVRPQQWRLQDVELWARSTGKRRLDSPAPDPVR
jgi:hypothetical protein